MPGDWLAFNKTNAPPNQQYLTGVSATNLGTKNGGGVDGRQQPGAVPRVDARQEAGGGGGGPRHEYAAVPSDAE